MIQSIFNALLNTLFVSIPEETIWVALVFMMLGRFDLLDWRGLKVNWKWFAIPVLPVSIAINVFRYIIIIPRPIMSLVTLIMLMILVTYVVKKTDFLHKIKSIKDIAIINIIVIICSLIIPITEFMYLPLYLYLSKYAMIDVNNNILFNFLLSLPAKLVQWATIFIIIYCKTINIKITQFIKILNNKFILIYIVATICLNFVLWVLVEKVLFNNDLLTNVLITTKMLIAISALILPILFLLVMVSYTLYNEHKNILIEKKYSNMLDHLE